MCKVGKAKNKSQSATDLSK